MICSIFCSVFQELLQSTTLPSQVEDIAARNPSLKCYMDNGYLNYERLAKCLEARNQQQVEKQSQLMGLAIVVQFMSKQVSREKESEKLDSDEWTETNKTMTARERERAREIVRERDKGFNRGFGAKQAPGRSRSRSRSNNPKRGIFPTVGRAFCKTLFTSVSVSVLCTADSLCLSSAARGFNCSNKRPKSIGSSGQASRNLP